MRVLLDEDIPIRLRLYFKEELMVETVEYRGWKGLKNGALLHAAKKHFDVLVTMDNSLPDQQPLWQFDLGVAILRPSSKTLEALGDLVPELERLLGEIRPGEVVRIHPSARTT